MNRDVTLSLVIKTGFKIPRYIGSHMREKVLYYCGERKGRKTEDGYIILSTLDASEPNQISGSKGFPNTCHLWLFQCSGSFSYAPQNLHKRLQATYHRDACKSVFSITLFTVIMQQPMCPPEECIKKMWYIHTFTETVEIFIISELSQAQKAEYQILPFVGSIFIKIYLQLYESIKEGPERCLSG